MNSTNTGGAAFPDPGRAQSAKQRERLTDTGMTLRDYFAAKAMQGFISAGPGELTETVGLIAELSYKIADALLVAREVQS